MQFPRLDCSTRSNTVTCSISYCGNYVTAWGGGGDSGDGGDSWDGLLVVVGGAWVEKCC